MKPVLLCVRFHTMPNAWSMALSELSHSAAIAPQYSQPFVVPGDLIATAVPGFY